MAIACNGYVCHAIDMNVSGQIVNIQLSGMQPIENLTFPAIAFVTAKVNKNWMKFSSSKDFLGGLLEL